MGLQLTNREQLTCNDLMIKNAVIAHMCGYPKMLEKVKTKFNVNKPKRKIANRVLIRKNANNYAHMQP